MATRRKSLRKAVVKVAGKRGRKPLASSKVVKKVRRKLAGAKGKKKLPIRTLKPLAIDSIKGSFGGSARPKPRKTVSKPKRSPKRAVKRIRRSLKKRS